MTIQDKINNEIKQAMLDKNNHKLHALRAVKTAFALELSKDGSDSLVDELSEKIISRLVKQRRESADIFSQQGREDLAQDEIAQLEYLTIYLPEQMSSNDLQKTVEDVIKEIGASSPKDIGRCMGILISRIGGKADGKLISDLVRKKLSN